MNKFYETLTNSRGDVLVGDRLQVVDSAGAAVDIFADNSSTPFTDSDGNAINYATADSNGLVEFYWTPAEGQVLQQLDPTGNLRRSVADFANGFMLSSFGGEIPQSQVANLTTDLDAKAVAADLAASTGAGLVGWIRTATGAVARTITAKLFGYVDVEDFGAAGDGVTNDTAAWTNGIAYVKTRCLRLRAMSPSYLVGELTFDGSNYTVETNGCQFIQESGLTGDANLHPIITFPEGASDIRLGDVRLTGNIATDSDEYSHGIAVLSADNITLGNVYGEDIRGDVLYTYGRTDTASAYQRNLQTGVIRGSNIFRNIVSMAGGEAQIAGIVQDGACGYRTFDVEPNTGGAYQPVAARVGFVRGATVQITSDDTAIINDSVQIGHLDLDGDRLADSSTPNPSYPGANAVPLAIAQVDIAQIGTLRLRNYESFAVLLGDRWGDVEISSCDFADVDTVETGQKTVFRQSGTISTGTLRIGKLKGVLADATRYVFKSDSGTLKYRIANADVSGGCWADSVSGDVGRLTLDVNGATDPIFGGYSGGTISKGAITNAGSAIGFFQCSNLTLLDWSDVTFGTVDYSSASTDIVAINSSINGAGKGVCMIASGAFKKVLGTQVTGDPGAASDAATTQSLANWLRTVVTTHGLGAA